MEDHRTPEVQPSDSDDEAAVNEPFRVLPVPDTEPAAEDQSPEPDGGPGYAAPAQPHLLALCFAYQDGKPEPDFHPFQVAFWCLAFEDVTLAYAPDEDGNGSIIKEFGSPQHACRILGRHFGPLRVVPL